MMADRVLEDKPEENELLLASLAGTVVGARREVTVDPFDVTVVVGVIT